MKQQTAALTNELIVQDMRAFLAARTGSSDAGAEREGATALAAWVRVPRLAPPCPCPCRRALPTSASSRFLALAQRTRQRRAMAEIATHAGKWGEK